MTTDDTDSPSRPMIAADLPRYRDEVTRRKAAELRIDEAVAEMEKQRVCTLLAEQRLANVEADLAEARSRLSEVERERDALRAALVEARQVVAEHQHWSVMGVDVHAQRWALLQRIDEALRTAPPGPAPMEQFATMLHHLGNMVAPVQRDDGKGRDAAGWEQRFDSDGAEEWHSPDGAIAYLMRRDTGIDYLTVMTAPDEGSVVDDTDVPIAVVRALFAGAPNLAAPPLPRESAVLRDALVECRSLIETLTVQRPALLNRIDAALAGAPSTSVLPRESAAPDWTADERIRADLVRAVLVQVRDDAYVLGEECDEHNGKVGDLPECPACALAIAIDQALRPPAGAPSTEGPREALAAARAALVRAERDIAAWLRATVADDASDVGHGWNEGWDEGWDDCAKELLRILTDGDYPRTSAPTLEGAEETIFEKLKRRIREEPGAATRMFAAVDDICDCGGSVKHNEHAEGCKGPLSGEEMK